MSLFQKNLLKLYFIFPCFYTQISWWDKLKKSISSSLVIIYLHSYCNYMFFPLIFEIGRKSFSPLIIFKMGNVTHISFLYWRNYQRGKSNVVQRFIIFFKIIVHIYIKAICSTLVFLQIHIKCPQTQLLVTVFNRCMFVNNNLFCFAYRLNDSFTIFAFERIIIFMESKFQRKFLQTPTLPLS